jgi:DNA polymerase-3 subunit alpha
MMAFITLEDLYGVIEIIVFPAVYDKFNKYIIEDSVVVVKGRISLSEEEDPKIICESVKPLQRFNKDKLYIKIPNINNKDIFSEIKPILMKYKGETPVYIYMEKKNKTIMAN